ncbi:hypothetical protein [Haloplanus salinus]|uniref:hypothetical protein n=1 Tax=Haloplanus salinus TaxID=1126245 RepID=UPI001FE76703|nr:hypothetical protein [Haloplanus salinus]
MMSLDVWPNPSTIRKLNGLRLEVLQIEATDGPNSKAAFVKQMGEHVLEACELEAVETL